MLLSRNFATGKVELFTIQALQQRKRPAKSNFSINCYTTESRVIGLWHTKASHALKSHVDLKRCGGSHEMDKRNLVTEEILMLSLTMNWIKCLEPSFFPEICLIITRYPFLHLIESFFSKRQRCCEIKRFLFGSRPSIIIKKCL